jgi:glycosyltransferase involved in cell wall biosynthesis
MKVKYFPYQPHCFAFGGFEIQMLNTLDAVIEAGVDASKLDIWSRDNDFDIIHLWGIGIPNYEVIDWAKKSGKIIIATVLTPYHDTLRSKLGYYYRRFLAGSGKRLIHYYSLVDKLVVINNLQVNPVRTYYKVPIDKIEIIPHIVEEKYLNSSGLNLKTGKRLGNYILCVGNICPRKNQVNLALACVNLNLKLVLVGNVLDGEENYGKKLEAITVSNQNILWIRELPNASEELIAIYFNCSVYALVSKGETQPISALEAVAMKKPLILLDRMYAHQSYYKGAILCKSPKVKDIEVALKKSLSSRNALKENLEILNCSAEKIGESYRNCYSRLFESMKVHNNLKSNSGITT